MKFAKQLERHSISEWTAFYLDYKSLKKILKSCDVQTTWNTALFREVGRLNAFFLSCVALLDWRIADLVAALRSDEVSNISTRVALLVSSKHAGTARERERVQRRDRILVHCKKAFSRLLNFFYQLGEFSSLNYKACYKILKKYEKLYQKTKSLQNC